MKLPALAVKNYQFTLVVFVLLLLFGLNSFLTMPRTENPSIFIPGGSLYVVYPGASPADLEELVAVPIEELVNELGDIKRISTSISDGLCVISCEFDYNTDAKEKYDEFVQKINSVRAELPEDIMHLETVQWTSSDVLIGQLAVVSDTASYRALEIVAERLKKKLERLNGIKRAEVLACPEQQVKVQLDLERMARMNISPFRVAGALQSNNANIPGGSIDVGDKSFGIVSSGSYQDLDEIKKTVVHSYNGKLVFLEDIAEVKYGLSEANWIGRYNGQKAVYVSLKQKEGYNVLDILEDVKATVQPFRDELSEEISLVYAYDQSIGVNRRINGFLWNLLQGIFVVGVVIFLALGYRSSIMVILAIPLSIVIGLGIVNLAGHGLQQISIAALVVALGLLVDNSIVMVENMNRFLAQGFKARDAAVKGASEIGWAIVAATITTLLAFVPVMMMPDKAGDFIKSLPLTIIATLTFSLLIALSLTPMLGSLVFRKTNIITNGRRVHRDKPFERFLKKVIDGPYRKTLAFAMRRKGIVISIVLVLFLASLATFPLVGVSFFPKAETPQFMVRIQVPEGNTMESLYKPVAEVEAILDSLPELSHYVTNIGHGNPRVYYNIFPKNYSRTFSEIFVELTDYDAREFDAIVEHLRKRFESIRFARVTIKEFEQGTPNAAPVMIYIDGDDLDMLSDISADIEMDMLACPGLINVENELNKSRTDLFFNINKEKAAMLGVQLHEIDQTIRMAIAGISVSSFRDDNGNERDIILCMNEENDLHTSDFDKIFIPSASGRLIQLTQLASIEFRKAPGIISRYNMQRTALLTADVKKGFTLDKALEPLIDSLEIYAFPPSYTYRFGGELEERNETFGGMRIAVLVALISIFAVLVLQFKSFRQPLIIYSAIPLAVIGSIWALLISGYTFSFTAFIGLTSLVGIVINNSIILVDYTNQLRKRGKSLQEALTEASCTRFSPILITTLTTIGGLLPLTIRGGTLWAPMGWTIIGGLLVSTVLTLIVVPVLYLFFTGDRNKGNAIEPADSISHS